MNNNKLLNHRKIKLISVFFLFALISITATINAQTQKGLDIDGEAAFDQSGWSVSMPDSNTLAIGAPTNDGNGIRSGHVRIYSWNGIAWQQKGSDIDGETSADQSGLSVSMADPNTLAIGAISNNGNGLFNTGQVRVFSWNGSSWRQKGSDIDGEAAFDQSGWSVSMPDVNTLVVGSRFNDGNGSDAGHARVYVWNSNAWQKKGLDIDGESAGDESGYSVCMPDSNTLAIGAPFNDGNGSNSGHVSVYSWDGNSWQQKGVDIDGEAAGDLFGYSVSMPDSNTLAIGAIKNDGNGSNSGHVRVYSWNGTIWQQKGLDIDGEAADDYSGCSVSMSDSNTIVIGALGNDGNGSSAGQVRIYSWNGISWKQNGADIDGEVMGDNFGMSVSMPDSNIFAIGALYNDGNGSNAGHVRVYSLCIDMSATTSSDTLTVNQSGAVYQWLNCDSSFRVINGATNQFFKASVNGNYACEISFNGCMDTTSCIPLIITDIVEESLPSGIKIYPNPVGDFLSVEIGSLVQNPSIRIRNVNGQLVYESSNLREGNNQIDFSNWAKGVYFVRIIGEDFEKAVKIVKQ